MTSIPTREELRAMVQDAWYKLGKTWATEMEWGVVDGVILPLLVERDTEISALRQAMWDGYGILGFDQDGNKTPDAVVDWPRVFVEACVDMRADYDEVNDEFAIVVRERDDARAEIERLRDYHSHVIADREKEIESLRLQAVTLDGEALEAFDRGASECDRLLGILRERHGDIHMDTFGAQCYVDEGPGNRVYRRTLLEALRAAVGDETR